jgi:hypothetical protein
MSEPPLDATPPPSPPPSFLCPFSIELMADPVSTMDGHCYDRPSIEKWFKLGHRTSPKTGNTLPSTGLLPIHTLRNAINEWLADNPAYVCHNTRADDPTTDAATHTAKGTANAIAAQHVARLIQPRQCSFYTAPASARPARPPHPHRQVKRLTHLQHLFKPPNAALWVVDAGDPEVNGWFRALSRSAYRKVTGNGADATPRTELLRRADGSGWLFSKDCVDGVLYTSHHQPIANGSASGAGTGRGGGTIRTNTNKNAIMSSVDVVHSLPPQNGWGVHPSFATIFAGAAPPPTIILV